MQSYREEAGSRPPVSQLDPLPAPVDRDDLSTYRARYEEAMNPFEAFRGRVSESIGSTSATERIRRSFLCGQIPEYWHLQLEMKSLSAFCQSRFRNRMAFSK